MSGRLRDRDFRAPSWFRARPFVVLAGVVSLVALSPVLREVYASLGTALGANVLFVGIALGCSLVAFGSTWALRKVTLRLDRWADVAGPQLAGNAASDLLPAGSVVGLAVELRMLRWKGLDLTRSITALTIAGLLSTVGSLCVFPVLVVLPIGDASGVDLANATRAGLIALAVCVPFAVLMLRSDRVLHGVGRMCQRAVACVPRCHPPSDLAARVVSERDEVRAALREHRGLAIAGALGHTVGEYFALYASLLATGTHPSPTVVLAAYIAGNAAGMIPFTPGGLGFVEAGLTAVLVLSGVAEGPALASVAVYRLVITWLPVLAGAAAYGWSRAHRVPAPTSAPVPISAPGLAVLEPASVA